MAAVLANEFAEATGELYLHALVEIGLVLFVITLIINVISRMFIWSMGARTPAASAAPRRPGRRPHDARHAATAAVASSSSCCAATAVLIALVPLALVLFYVVSAGRQRR